MKKTFALDLYYSPCCVIKEFEKLLKNNGIQILKDTDFQKERELWITAVFLLGLHDKTKKNYWLRPTNENTPDVIAFYRKLTNRGTIKMEMFFEITEYESHTESLSQLIEKKLRKNYPAKYRLLIYSYGRAGEEINFEKIYSQLQTVSPKIMEIWLISSILHQNENKYTIVQLFPNRFQEIYDYNIVCKKKRQRDFIKDLGRGISKKLERV